MGGMVPLAEVVTPEWSVSPLQLNRHNGYPSLSLPEAAVEASRLRLRPIVMTSLAFTLVLRIAARKTKHGPAEVVTT